MKSASPSLDNEISAVGRVTLRAWNGPSLVHHATTSNLVTTAGLAVIAQSVSGASPGVTHIATGSNTTAANISDTALGAEAYRDQVTQFQRSGDGAVTFRLFIGAAQANGTEIREAGLFTADEGGDLVARVVFSAVDQISKTSDITAQISWTITFS